MQVKEIQNKIEKGVELLKNGFFPESILFSLKEERLRGDIKSKIFELYQRELHLSNKERMRLKIVQKVKVEFDTFYNSFVIIKNISYILIIMGGILFGTGMIGMNNNSIHGLITALVGVLLYLISLSKDGTIKSIPYFLTIYLSEFIIEVFVFGIPGKFFNFFNADPFSSRGAALITLLNEFVPYAYVLIRLFIGYMLVRVWYSQSKYLRLKISFEESF